VSFAAARDGKNAQSLSRMRATRRIFESEIWFPTIEPSASRPVAVSTAEEVSNGKEILHSQLMVLMPWAITHELPPNSKCSSSVR